MNTTTKLNRKSQERNVGIDVGKDTLDIHIYELDKHWQVANTSEGINVLIKQLN